MPELRVPNAPPRPRWKVWLTQPKKRPVVVTADYFRVDGGVLIFRNVSTGGSYPVTIAAFAAGGWQRMEQMLD